MELILNIGNSLSSDSEPFLRSLIFLTFEGVDFDLKLEFTALKFIDGLGSSLSRDANAVDQESAKYIMTVTT